MNRRAVTAVCSSWINNTGGAAAWPSLSRSSTSSHISSGCVCTDPCSLVLAHESVQYWAASRTPVMMLTDGRITRRDNETGPEPEVEDRIEAEIHPRSWGSTENKEKCWSPSACSSEQSHSPVWSSLPSVNHHVEASIKKSRDLMSPVWGLQQKSEVRREARTWEKLSPHYASISRTSHIWPRPLWSSYTFTLNKYWRRLCSTWSMWVINNLNNIKSQTRITWLMAFSSKLLAWAVAYNCHAGKHMMDGRWWRGRC